MRTPGNKTILLILGALVALLVAGCGGGGGDETETSTPTVEEPTALTKDELITQGDGICAEVNAAVGALSGSETPETTPGESTEKVANLYVGMIERLQDLGAPEGEEADYAKFMEAGEELAKVEGEAKLAAEREDMAALEEKGQEASGGAGRASSRRRRSTASKTAATNPACRPSTAARRPGRRRIRRRRSRRRRRRTRIRRTGPRRRNRPRRRSGAGNRRCRRRRRRSARSRAPETGGESGGVGPVSRGLSDHVQAEPVPLHGLSQEMSR